jgi:putative transposase
MMRKSIFTDEQKVKILRQAEATSVAEVAREHGLVRETIYNWRRMFSGVDIKEARRLKELERENRRLKKLVIERDLEIEVMKEIAAKKW